MDKIKVGNTLAALRKERNESTLDVAAAVGISQSAVSMYENGVRIPRDDIKYKLSQHYGVPVGQIFFAE